MAVLTSLGFLINPESSKKISETSIFLTRIFLKISFLLTLTKTPARIIALSVILFVVKFLYSSNTPPPFAIILIFESEILDEFSI